MEDIKSTFPSLYDGNTANRKPIANRNREHMEKFGLQKTLFDLGHENLLEIEKIQKTNLTTIMFFLTYLKDKSFAEAAQEQLDESIRKSKRH